MKETVMLNKIILPAITAALVLLVLPAKLDAYGACHTGYTHVGPNGAYHTGSTTVAGPGGAATTSHTSAYGAGGGAYHSSSGAAYGNSYHYSPSYSGGVQSAYYVR